ncbi:MAG: hypothetical protein ACLTXH_03555 [Enterobacter hormaechei]
MDADQTAASSGKIRDGLHDVPEFSNIFEKALARRFQKIDVAEPSVDETVQIINGLVKYEAHHDVR